jgi:hypothetical protein
MAGKENCWDYMECGRGPGSGRVVPHGSCPATKEMRLHGTHGGMNAGRACWVIAGTLCGGGVAGTFASKFRDCKVCPFFLQVKKDEHPNFKMSATLLSEFESDL